MIQHYHDGAASLDWLWEMIEMEVEGERTPIQTEPHEAVLDELTPMLLRRQA